MVLLYLITAFLGAALLFVVQPMLARMVLPLLGGSPAVWNTTMVFFQAALLAGYGYAHLSTSRLGTGRQSWLHLGLMLVPLSVLPLGISQTGLTHGWENPVPWLFALLAGSVGIPFFVIASTGPLLQRWFTTSGHPRASDPYFLFAAGNLGSLVGLVAYPLWIEPRFKLADQSALWAAGYGLLMMLTYACAIALRLSKWRARAGAVGVVSAEAVAIAPLPKRKRGGSKQQTRGEEDAAQRPINLTRRLRWMALAAVPSGLVLAVTQHITTDIASVPLLWALPLALYLISFIIVFARGTAPNPRLAAAVLPFVGIAIAVTRRGQWDEPMFAIIGLHLAGLLVAATACHGVLSEDRPSSTRLTEYYFWIALGGVVGGAFDALVAPLIFSSVLEYPLLLGLAFLLIRPLRFQWSGWSRAGTDLVLAALLATASVALVAAWSRVPEGRGDGAWLVASAAMSAVLLLWIKRPARFGLALVALLLANPAEMPRQARLVHAERSFFGVHKVTHYPPNVTVLFSGTTIHGIQDHEPAHRRQPLGYYHPLSPVADALILLGQRHGRQVAVVGLGAGSLAAYARPGESWTFLEIDPTVVRIARTPGWFTYLEESPGDVQVVVGDARQSLQRERTGRFDLIILDAYSSDAVPVHLLTREALQLYLDRLAPHGSLVFHISSRHFDLAPVIANLAADARLVCRLASDRNNDHAEWTRGRLSSTYVVVARRAEDLGVIASDPSWMTPATRPDVGVWTDDYSSLWKVLKRRG